MPSLSKNIRWVFPILALALILALTLANTDRTQADTPPGGVADPLGCFSNGVGISTTVYRDDRTTPVATSGGSVQSGEPIKYEATLSHLGGSNCNFESGTLTIITPDGVPHIVASGS